MHLPVHIVEPGGKGGVFQHSVALGVALAEEGFNVTVHTASDCETLVAAGVVICKCVNLYPTIRSRLRRKIAGTIGFSVRTLPHLRRSMAGCTLIWQGAFAPPIYVLSLLVLRGTARKLIFCPHNTFSRYGGTMQDICLRIAARTAHVLVAYTSSSAAAMSRWGREVHRLPLVQLVPTPARSAVERWRTWMSSGESRYVILVAGQIRYDKGIEDAIRAVAILGRDFSLAVLGEDRGGLVEARQCAETSEIDVKWSVSYLPLLELVAAISAADVVVLPYRQADQSGVAVLAQRLGVPTVGYPVGGLKEQCSVVAVSSDSDALAEAIKGCISNCPPARGAGAEVLTSRDLALFDA